jgi:hypothetical protein
VRSNSSPDLLTGRLEVSLNLPETIHYNIHKEFSNEAS